MSFFEKNPYSSGFIDKKESISEQQSDSPRRLKVALKYFRSDEKIHNDGQQPTDSNINSIETTSNDAAAAETTDGIVPKVRYINCTMNEHQRLRCVVHKIDNINEKKNEKKYILKKKSAQHMYACMHVYTHI